jgi:predicted negative regulator of RcsB-dependent stress response
MGWEQRGNNRYFYRKERDGSQVKSVYVGRGEIAHMISQFESSSAELEKLMRTQKSIEADELERVEAALDRAIELTQRKLHS